MVQVTCEQCGEEFKTFPAEIRRGGGKFCSTRCYSKWCTGKNNPRFKKKILKTCLHCGMEYGVIPSQGDSKFCSHGCYSKYRGEVYTGDKNPAWKGGKIKRICTVCGGPFYIKPHKANDEDRGKFCSHRCQYLKRSDEDPHSQMLLVELERRGIQFEREKPIGRYYADFFILPGIIIECDGWQHKRFKKDHDEKRDQWLRSKGYRVFRLTTEEIDQDVAACLDVALKSPSS